MTTADDSDDKGPSGGVAAVSRALSILAVIETSAEPVTLTEISKRSGLYKSTALRLLETLIAAAYVAKLEDGTYVLGAAVMRMGIAYESHNPLRRQLRPVVKRLVQDAGDSVSFHIRQGPKERLCLLRIDAAHGTLDRVREGDTLPLERGAAGKVITLLDRNATAALSDAEIQLSLGERDKTCAGMAGPVWSAGGHFLGALSISGPKERFTPDDVARIRPLLLQACREASAVFGFTLSETV